MKRPLASDFHYEDYVSDEQCLVNRVYALEEYCNDLEKKLNSSYKLKALNLNTQVSVELTKYGAKQLNDKNNELLLKYPSITTKPDLHYEGEIYKTQLWSLFEDFGDMIYLSNTNLPFKNNNITIIE